MEERGGRIEESYRAAGKFFSMTFTHLDFDERVEAGFSYEDALYAKDEIERRYLDGDGSIDRERMAEEDGLMPENIKVNHEDMSVDFEKGDLGEWQEVYENIREMAEYTVENFYEDREKGRRLADYEALLRTLGWRNHKIGAKNKHGKWIYDGLMSRAHKVHVRSAIQYEEYPEKHSQDGDAGPGLLGLFWLKMVEFHDMYRKNEGYRTRKEGIDKIKQYAKEINQRRKERIDELEMGF